MLITIMITGFMVWYLFVYTNQGGDCGGCGSSRTGIFGRKYDPSCLPGFERKKYYYNSKYEEYSDYELYEKVDYSCGMGDSCSEECKPTRTKCHHCFYKRRGEPLGENDGPEWKGCPCGPYNCYQCSNAKFCRFFMDNCSGSH